MKKLKIETIKEFVRTGKIRWTNHCVVRLFQRNISQEDIENALLNGEIIEEYENDYPYPSCLVYGVNLNNKVLHVVCGANETELWVITAYYPDNIKWEETGKIRWTNHCVVRLFQRNISQEDIENALLNGEIIEEYENDYPYPSCLVYGVNLNNKVLHVVCGANETELWVITAYYPDNIKWEDDLKTRKEIE